MVVIRRRLIFWLLKAYFKKWGKSILAYFMVGLVVFYLLSIFVPYFITHLPFTEKESIGMVGAYTIESLPKEILTKVSRGLTRTEADGTVKPDIANKWKIAPNGKGYAFYLNKNIYFSDGKNLTSDDINYNFADVEVIRPDKYTIVFNLKDSYSPFLTTVSRPIFKKGYIGVGDYVIKKIKLNGNFIESVELFSDKYRKTIAYSLFYPTYTSLKTAFMLGELSEIASVPDLKYAHTDFSTYKNISANKKTDYSKLVTIFYNTRDKSLSSKLLREGLSYAIPDIFDQGERNGTPIPPFSFIGQGVSANTEDLEHAKDLVGRSETATASGRISVVITTLSRYEDTAEIIAKNWEKIGIDTEIKTVNQIPDNFQIFLGDFNLSTDPDQYALWHSSQATNISQYNNPRIDKLLEDGRKELDTQKRIIIYNDFQKYLLSDPPASFLYFPYYYEISRK
jgi:peptide/nickel transport system substrate-binding protein